MLRCDTHDSRSPLEARPALDPGCPVWDIALDQHELHVGPQLLEAPASPWSCDRVTTIPECRHLDGASSVSAGERRASAAGRLYRRPPRNRPAERKRHRRYGANPDFDQYSVAASLARVRRTRPGPTAAARCAPSRCRDTRDRGTLDHTPRRCRELKQLRPDMKLVLIEGVSPYWANRDPRAGRASSGDPASSWCPQRSN